MKTTTIRVSAQTHQRITKQAKWGEPLEDVIIELLNYQKNTKENIKKFYEYLVNFQDTPPNYQEIAKKFAEMFL
jgi:hypothetical protein